MLAQVTEAGVLASALALTLPSMPIRLTVYEAPLWLLKRTPYAPVGPGIVRACSAAPKG
jgi:hypothetical protein